MSWTASEAEAALVRAGLDPRAFDLEATAADLQERADLNHTLDDLVRGQQRIDPTAGFDARWAS